MTGVCCGFYGKIPARGDFVRARLPGGFVAAWDGWLQSVIPASRALLGEDWLPAWLEAPVWRFALDGGVCGADAVLGVWMPSVDRAGRHFPLTLAAVVPGARAESLVGPGAAWLAVAERAGLDAVTDDTAPERLAAALDAAPAPDAAQAEGASADLPSCPGNGRGRGEDTPVVSAASRWWTGGAPRVAARALALPGLPDGSGFAAMLDDRIRDASR